MCTPTQITYAVKLTRTQSDFSLRVPPLTIDVSLHPRNSFLLFKRVLNKIPSNPYTPSTSHVKRLTQPIISPLIEVNINVHNYWFVTVIYRVLPSNTGL